MARKQFFRLSPSLVAFTHTSGFSGLLLVVGELIFIYLNERGEKPNSRAVSSKYLDKFLMEGMLGVNLH